MAKAHPHFARPSPDPSSSYSALILTGFFFLQLLSAILAAPYYLTYYNPLLGGLPQAVAQVPVGWGEGLEQAAFYLNDQPEAGSLAVSSWYSDIFNPYFVGKRVSFSDDGRAQLSADFVVFYVNQIQRQKPYPGLVDFFRAAEPVLTIDLGAPTNPHWVELYRAPAAQSAGGAPKIEGVAQLLAYKIAATQPGTSAQIQPSQTVPVTLYWRVLGPMPAGAGFKLALTGSGQHWGRWQPAGSSPAAAATNHRSPDPNLPSAAPEHRYDWQTDQVVEWSGSLTLPPDIPPGDYRLWLGLVGADGATIAELSLSEKDPPIQVGTGQRSRDRRNRS
jgi:hypothetical protein